MMVMYGMNAFNILLMIMARCKLPPPTKFASDSLLHLSFGLVSILCVVHFYSEAFILNVQFYLRGMQQCYEYSLIFLYFFSQNKNNKCTFNSSLFFLSRHAIYGIKLLMQKGNHH